MLGLPIYWKTFERLEHSVRTGQSTTDTIFEGGSWQYLAEHPEESQLFDEAMIAKAHAQIPAILGAYDFSPFRRIADIGGGHGHLLRAILDKNPGATGVLFDQPHVIEAAARAGRTDRLTFAPGDFFADTLPVAYAYLLMQVIHDWNDDRAARIIEAVRRSMPPDGRVLVIETVIGEQAASHWDRLLDIAMLSILGGKERTRDQYARLLAQSDLRLDREIDTGAGISILEAVPV